METPERATPEQMTPEQIAEMRRLHEIEQKPLDEAATTARNEEVRVLRANGAALAERINAKVSEIIERDLVDFHDILKRLSDHRGMPGNLAQEAIAEMRTALRPGPATNVEQRLISAGWTHRADMVELPIRSLRPPGGKS